MPILAILGEIQKVMETIAATKASNNFGQLLDHARSEPVTIEKNGRGVAVVLSIEEYTRMEDELEGLQNVRLADSIVDMKVGKTKEARSVFEDLKNRYR